MNKVAIGIICSSVLLVSCGKTEIVEVSQNTATPTTLSEGVIENTAVLSANYEEYNQGSLGESENTVIFFHASWCPSCMTLDKNLLQTGVPEGTKVLKADFDTETELRKKYGVTTQHTFVQVDASGEMIQKWVGANTVEDITEKLSSENKETAMEKTQEVSEVMEKEEGEMIKDDIGDDDTVMEKQDIMEKQDVMEKPQAPVEAMEKEEVMEKEVVLSSGVFSTYSPDLVGKTENTVIFFHASWCPSCRTLETAINSGDIPAGLTVLKADFDNETELKQKYGVVSQHTLVSVDADGNQLRKWAGGSTLESITEKLN